MLSFQDSTSMMYGPFSGHGNDNNLVQKSGLLRILGQILTDDGYSIGGYSIFPNYHGNIVGLRSAKSIMKKLIVMQ